MSKSKVNNKLKGIKLPFVKDKEVIDEEHQINKNLSKLTFQSFLGKIKPRERIVFHSDYYTVDGKYCSILSFTRHDSKSDNRSIFWGISRLLVGNIDDVELIVIDSVSKYNIDWVKSRFKSFEKNIDIASREDNKKGMMEADKLKETIIQGSKIASEVNAGASYLNVKMRLLIKAKSLEALDHAISLIRSRYENSLQQITIHAFDGMQKYELSNLFSPNKKILGKGFDFTSTEYAGAYCIASRGLNDPFGEYVGNTLDDINNVAVMFDVDNYDKTVVLAHDYTFDDISCNPHLSDMWCSKISQSAMLRGHRVMHIVLNNIDMNELGPNFKDISTTLDLSHGYINPFAMFGEYTDELNIFPAHIRKLQLLMSQFMDTKAIPGFNPLARLSTILTDFYKSKNMWTSNPEHNREYIHILGLKHEDYPTLADFVVYLEFVNKAAAVKGDSMYQAEVKAIYDTFNSLMEVNSDVFGQVTDDIIDTLSSKRRVVYDLSKLFERDSSVAMAAFVNLLGFVFAGLSAGDVIIIHGVDYIKSISVKGFLSDQIALFRQKKGRMVLSYNSVATMLEDKAFNEFTKADYTILSSMDRDTLKSYMNYIGEVLPPELTSTLSNITNHMLSYIHRGFENAIFNTNLIIDYKPKSKPKSTKKG